MDPGESDDFVTALRETEEESGLCKADLEISDDFKHDIYYNIKWDGVPKRKKLSYYLAHVIHPEKIRLSHEHCQYNWFSFNQCIEIFNKKGHDTQAEAFNAAKEYLLQADSK